MAAQLCSLLIILAIDKLLNFSAEAIQRSTCLPSSHEISDNHAQSTSLHDCSLKVKPAHKVPECTLNTRGLSINVGKELFLLLLLKGLLFSKLTLYLSLL